MARTMELGQVVTLALEGWRTVIPLLGERECGLVVLGVDEPEAMARTIAARTGAPLRSAEVVSAPDPADRGDELSPAP